MSLRSSARIAPSPSSSRQQQHAATELHMLEIEVEHHEGSRMMKGGDARSPSRRHSTPKTQEGQHREHRPCLSSGSFLDYYATKSKSKNNSAASGGGAQLVAPTKGGTGESSGGMSSCHSSVTRSTADVTSSSCDSSFSQEQQTPLILEQSLEISAVDTHTSILNITEDEDFEEEEEDADEDDDGDCDGLKSEKKNAQVEDEDMEPPLIDVCQFEEVHPNCDEFAPHASVSCTEDHPLLMEATTDGQCIAAGRQSLSFMENFVESFVETLCFSKRGGSDPTRQDSVPPLSADALEKLESKLESDMTTILGCLGPDSVTEMKHAQCMLDRLLCNHYESDTDASARPRRTKRQRMRRLQKLQEERGRDGFSVLAVRSMQDLNYSRSNLGDDGGYDSDPDDVLLVSSSPFNNPNKKNDRSPSPSSVTTLHPHENPQDWQDNLHPIVQESLNSVWDLTWHQPNSLTPCSTPVRVTAWMERGTIIRNNSIMIEPRLMWKTSSSTQPLVALQLMHVCRVIPADALLDRRRHPLARPSTSYIVRTTTADRHRTCDYVFQAASIAERDALVHRWKVTVARFATLAVLEDAETLLKEFFVTASAFPAPLRRSSVC